MLLCSCVGLGRAIKRRTDTECYCVCFRVWRGQYREELILNVTVYVVRVWGGQCREELILNVTVFVSGSGEGNVERN